MIIYVPVYNRKWYVEQLNTDDCYYRSSPGYTSSLIYKGVIIFNGDNVFDNPLSAVQWIHKEYAKAFEHWVDLEEYYKNGGKQFT